MKIITVYFSRKGQNYFAGSIKSIERGNTEVVASYIHEAVGGDIFEIETAKDYPASYNECTQVAKIEKSSAARPELKKYVDLSNYDIIFVGYPNWWGTMPMAVITLLEKSQLQGKKIVPFCTHEGSLMGVSEHDLLKVCKGATVMKGLPVQGSSVYNRREEVTSWAKSQV